MVWSTILVPVMVWKCHAFTGCMGQPSTFNDFERTCVIQGKRTFLVQDCSALTVATFDLLSLLFFVHAMIVMPRPLPISQETINIVLY